MALFRKITTALVFASFAAMAILSFAGMSYGSDGSMQSDCPFTTAMGGTAQCAGSALFAGAIHHLSAVQSFLSVPVHSDITALLASFLAAGIIFLFIHPLLYSQPPSPRFSFIPPVSFRTQKITRWLSLLENSPSTI